MKQLTQKSIEKIELLEDNLRRWWMGFPLRIIIRDFITGVKNLIKWFPIIWKDRDWDYRYIFDILKQKLYFTAKYHIEQEYYEGWEREVELMTTCIRLIDYIINDHYEDKLFDFLNEKYGEYDNKSLFTRSKITTIEQEKEYDIDCQKGFEEAYQKQEKAKRLLFYILNERIMRWWV